jgi:hypothetical protein
MSRVNSSPVLVKPGMGLSPARIHALERIKETLISNWSCRRDRRTRELIRSQIQEAKRIRKQVVAAVKTLEAPAHVPSIAKLQPEKQELRLPTTPGEPKRARKRLEYFKHGIADRWHERHEAKTRGLIRHWLGFAKEQQRLVLYWDEILKGTTVEKIQRQMRERGRREHYEAARANAIKGHPDPNKEYRWIQLFEMSERYGRGYSTSLEGNLQSKRDRIRMNWYERHIPETRARIRRGINDTRQLIARMKKRGRTIPRYDPHYGLVEVKSRADYYRWL